MLRSEVHTGTLTDLCADVFMEIQDVDKPSRRLNVCNKFEGSIYLRFRRKTNCFNNGIIIIFGIQVRELTSFGFVHLDVAR